MNDASTFALPFTRRGRARRWQLLASILLLAACMQLATRPAAAADRVVTLVGDPWPPYVEGEIGGTADSGLAVLLARRIFERMDSVDVVFPLIPWKRALREVKSGSSDGIGALLKTPEREQYMLYTDPLFVASGLVWYSSARRPGGFEWHELADLQKGRLGVTRGYSYGDEVDAAIKDGSLTVTEVPNVGRLMAMLAAGRIDLAIANDSVGYALAREHPAARIVPASRPTASEVFFMAISKKSSAVSLVPEINRILADLKAQGVIEDILGRK